jgi:hypothetical protein
MIQTLPEAKTHPVSFTNVKAGSILSEVQFYTVSQKTPTGVIVVNERGESITLNKRYVETCLVSADQYVEKQNISRTELSQLILGTANTAMLINYNKKVKEDDVVNEISEAYENSTPKEARKKMADAIKRALKGEERVIIGYHQGHLDSNGRLHFIDMEEEKDEAKNYDTRHRLVDFRTLNSAVIKGVLYVVK